MFFITTDNPRREDPQKIVADILLGIEPNMRHKVVIEPDRECAIRQAYEQSEHGTIIALIGKGQDEYQLIGNQKIPFNERTIITTLGRVRQF
jgi:UDP-N-acetylmuramoyl-L-alanyl-D-glutamate--2,6-diaminopimelate ligase